MTCTPCHPRVPSRLENYMVTHIGTVGQTGATCLVSGIYAPNCNGKQIALSRAETFPPCSHCHRAVTWTLVQATREVRK